MTEKELKLVSVLLKWAYVNHRESELKRAEKDLRDELGYNSPATDEVIGRYSRAAQRYEESLNLSSDVPGSLRRVAVPRQRGSAPVVDRKSYCESCGSLEKLQGHHEDYSRPNETVTLCARCHSRAHNGHETWVWKIE